MPIQIELPPDTEAKLRERAIRAGQDVAAFVRAVVEEKLAEPESFSQMLAQIHSEIAQQHGGVPTEEELDQLIEECRNEVYAERQAKLGGKHG